MLKNSYARGRIMTKRKYRIVIEGKAYEVEVEEIEAGAISPTAARAISRPAAPPPPITKPVVPVRSVGAPVSPRPKVVPPSTPEAAPQEGTITAPIPGTVLRVNFKVGDSVNHGDELLILEAMKMENEIIASKAGIVKKIVSPNTTVDFGAVLCIIE